MFKSWITNNCGFFASVLVIVYVLVVSSSTGDIIGLKIAEDAGPTVIPFPENLREGLKYAHVSSLFPNSGGRLAYSNMTHDLVFDPGTAYQWLAKGEIDTAIFNVIITERTSGGSSVCNEGHIVDGSADIVITVKIEIEGINSPPVSVDNDGMASCTSSVMVGERGSCSASFYDVDHSDFTPGSGYYSQLELRGIPLERCVTFARKSPGEGIITVYCSFQTDNCGDIGLLEGLEVILEDGKGGKAFAPANTVSILPPVPIPVPIVSHNVFTIILDGTTGISQLTNDDIKLIGSESTTGSACKPLLDMLTVAPRVFSCDELGPEGVVATLTAFADGQTASKNFTVIVADMTPPVLGTKNGIKLPIPSSGSLVLDPIILFSAEGSFDACGIDLNSLSVGPDRFTCDDLGSNEVQLSARDYSGNSAVTNARVDIFDNTAPTIKVLDKVAPIHLDELGWAIVDPFLLVHASDECGISSITSFPSEFTCKGLGLREITVIVEDIAGNNASVTLEVEVVDKIPPSIMISRDVELHLNASGVVDIDTSQLVDSVTDTCGGPLYLNSEREVFSCKDIGMHEIKVTSQDKSGNLAHVLVNVMITDNIPPLIETVHDLKVTLNELGVAELDDPYVVIESLTDECGIASIKVEPQFFKCSDVGKTEIRVTAQDLFGNTVSVLTDVLIVDETSPFIKSASETVTLTLNEFGLIEVDPSQIIAFVNDACDPVAVEVEPEVFNCNDLGKQQVLITAQDNSGNTASVTANVMISDTTPPSIKAIEGMKLVLDNGLVELDSSLLVNETSDECGVISLNVEPKVFNCSDVGRKEVRITAQDTSRNTATVLTHVEIVDETAPVLVASDNVFLFQLDSNGSAHLDGTTLLNFDKSFDSCGIDLGSVSVEPKWLGCGDVGYSDVEIRAQDTSGNEAQVATSIIVQPMLHEIPSSDGAIYLPSKGMRRMTIATLPLPPLRKCQLVNAASSQDGITWRNLGNPKKMGLVIISTSEKKRGQPALHSLGVSAWHSKRRAAALNDAVCTPMRLRSKLMITVTSQDFQGERCFMFQNVVCPPGNGKPYNAQLEVTATPHTTSTNVGFLGCADGEEFMILGDD